LGGAASVVALVLTLRRLRDTDNSPGSPADATTRTRLPSFRGWEDVYRERWTWDRVACGTHTAANCVAACAWNLYVRDDIVWREEQSAPYTTSNPSVPDWNPRGCQKGACYSDLATGPSRVLYPLRRIGPRGGRQWKRISWDEALDEVASALVDVLARRGGEGAICELGGHLEFGPIMASALRFFRQIGAPVTDSTAMVGDVPAGATITLGEAMVGGSSDEWFLSDYIVLWAFNPSATRIPDAHYLNEARYRGARVVAIAPDFNQSAVHTDLWLPTRPGSDAALALAACHVVIEENLHRVGYLCEQTDLPFLVREDTGRFLRESDLVDGGSDSVFAVLDQANGKIVWAPGSQGSEKKTLVLPEGVRPALETRAEVQLPSGARTTVRSVFSILRERLRGFRPEDVSAATGVSPELIRRFARELAGARSALIIASYGMCKNLHSDLAQRAQILLASLTGNIGKPGGGWQSIGFIALDGMGLVAMQDRLDIPNLVWTGVQSMLDPAEVRSRFMNIFVSSSLFHAVHGGIGEIQTSAAYGDPSLPEGTAPYLREAIEKGHFPVGPAPGSAPPEVIVSMCGNVLRHSRMGNRLRDHLFAKAALLVDVTFRMSETAMFCDILLPAAGWYEKIGFKYIPAYIPYVTLGDRAVTPLGESKAEWEIFALLAERVATLARNRGIGAVRGFRGNDCDIATLDERFTDHGRFKADGQADVAEFILSVSSQTKGISLDDLRKNGGAMRLAGIGGAEGIRSPYDASKPITPYLDCTGEKRPYPTLTGRQQFYVDHPWFLKVGEELPTHKEPPAAGGNHPFTLTGGHTRWSIHAVWRDHALMLRLQRGEPVVFVNTRDAGRLAIRDHDDVRVWNDLGSFEAKAIPTAAIQPGQVHIFHAWEPYQFRSEWSHQALSPSPIKITQLVGDYGHLRWSYGHYDPNQVDRDTRVSLAKA
jgi:DMSO reductase family type II enzyme molybdopterin subunit